MQNKKPKEKALYQKHHSFANFYSKNSPDTLGLQLNRCLKTLEGPLSLKGGLPPFKSYTEVLEKTLSDLKAVDGEFKLTPFIAAEIALLKDEELGRYLFHRYRYDVHPQKKILDEFPPYLQIEPASLCNFRCVFCYQTDKSFSTKKSGMMGQMEFPLYQKIVDQVEGKVEFISLASRGEPTLCKDLPLMLDYSRGKFLNLKINTNASKLTESLCHSLLSGSVRTVVFSADAAEEPLYSQLRVGGNLKTTLANVEMFQTIREKEYAKVPLITRVSGVKVQEEQSMDLMEKQWGGLVDQVSFVKYNPWENTYDASPNEVVTPCSDLWRRMFIWYDGIVNPCDSDYKSHLTPGKIQDHSVAEIWKNSSYSALRKTHEDLQRQQKEPCRRCFVV